MITSEYGLCNLPHIIAPAGKAELRASVFEAEFPEISALKWYFIRGVKTVSSTLDGVDMMRGEETELMGIAKEGEGALYVMPGTHSKHVSIDKNGAIVSFKTMMTGELFAAVSSGTILKDAISGASGDPIPERLRFGYEYCRDKGLNEALFKTRILKNLFGASPLECYSFLIGALLCDEILPIRSAPEKKIIITGQRQLRQAIAYLLEDSGKEITVLDDDAVSSSTAIGAVRIFEYNTQ
jgi:2-dehydro-3-deoxygalactonokinase